jgi:hypothetical protein
MFDPFTKCVRCSQCIKSTYPNTQPKLSPSIFRIIHNSLHSESVLPSELPSPYWQLFEFKTLFVALYACFSWVFQFSTWNFDNFFDPCTYGIFPLSCMEWGIRQSLVQWFSNSAPQEVARRATNIMKVYFKNEKKPICIEIFIHSLKYIIN